MEVDGGAALVVVDDLSHRLLKLSRNGGVLGVYHPSDGGSKPSHGEIAAVAVLPRGGLVVRDVSRVMVTFKGLDDRMAWLVAVVTIARALG